ncbi:hypothetical protein C7974DRAFT_442705 [Boeremia exigua]|uniref:uncharacterized protein n=1 Tax=Boeremia exigua TaxID=749465 RepID=UPI001E8D0EFA|nr:uncharacterized protein C7974DRAFT_442705 [Boeremia exigua]KAH6616855.1 hypothetical protein C7974DRAFT_442705 [Boeremia exigua]
MALVALISPNLRRQGMLADARWWTRQEKETGTSAGSACHRRACAFRFASTTNRGLTTRPRLRLRCAVLTRHPDSRGAGTTAAATVTTAKPPARRDAWCSETSAANQCACSPETKQGPAAPPAACPICRWSSKHQSPDLLVALLVALPNKQHPLRPPPPAMIHHSHCEECGEATLDVHVKRPLLHGYLKPLVSQANESPVNRCPGAVGCHSLLA